MNKLKLIGLAMFCITIFPFAVSAGDIEEAKNLLCATIETFDCVPGGECLRGTAMNVNLPQFIRINFKEKKISGIRESGEVLTTKIENMARIDGRLILQGIQEGKAWSIVITEPAGKMTVTVSDDQAGFVIFGACTTP